MNIIKKWNDLVLAHKLIVGLSAVVVVVVVVVVVGGVALVAAFPSPDKTLNYQPAFNIQDSRVEGKFGFNVFNGVEPQLGDEMEIIVGKKVGCEKSDDEKCTTYMFLRRK
jgi:hypothetical protein